MRSLILAICGMALALLVAGCASHPHRVNCEAQLKPINAPAPVAPSGGP